MDDELVLEPRLELENCEVLETCEDVTKEFNVCVLELKAVEWVELNRRPEVIVRDSELEREVDGLGRQSTEDEGSEDVEAEEDGDIVTDEEFGCRELDASKLLGRVVFDGNMFFEVLDSRISYLNS